MAGLRRLAKIYGSIKMVDQEGNSIVWIWDYEKNEPRKKNELSKEELDRINKSRKIFLRNSKYKL